MKTIRKHVSILVAALLLFGTLSAPFAVTDSYAGSLSEKSKAAAEKSKDAAKKVKDTAADKGKDTANKAKNAAKKGKDNAVEKGKTAVEKGKTAAKNGKASANDKGKTAKAKVKGWYSNIDKKDFKEGWDHAVDLATSDAAAQMGSKYVAEVGAAIEKFGSSVNASKASARGVAQEAGFVAEKWTTETFNIDAIARGSSSRASTPGSNKLASADVTTNYGEKASLKYYQTASKSASEQAKTLIEKYEEYAATSDNPMSMKDYLDKNGYDSKTQEELLNGIYEGQTRIIPADQYDDAVKYLEGRISRLSKQKGKKAAALSNTYQDTLDSLSDRLKDPKGTQSRPATKEEIEAVTELAKNGDFKPEDFGFTVSQIITPKYIVKQAINTGEKTAALNMAIKLGPELYSIIAKAIQTGEIDKEDFQKMGLDAVISGSEGFLEGSISSAILIAGQSGKLGPQFVNASPDVVGALTVIAIDSVRYGYALSKGDITALQFGDLMAEEVVTSAGAMAAGVGLTMLFGSSVVIAMAGCLAGGMLASIGYNTGKQAVLEVRDAGGFAAIVPTDTIKGVLVDSKEIASLKLNKAASMMNGMKLSTLKDGKIQVLPWDYDDKTLRNPPGGGLISPELCN